MINQFKFRKNENTKYRWKYNYMARFVFQFLKYTEYSADEIVNLKVNDIQTLLDSYADSLKGINAESTILNKVCAVIYFFSVNHIKIESDLVFDVIELDYDEELEQYPPNSDTP